MTIRVLVCWDTPEEVNMALEVREWMDKALDNHDMHSGYRTVNDPIRSFGIIVSDRGDVK